MSNQAFADCPQLLRDFLFYMQTIRGRSQKTVEAYHGRPTATLVYVAVSILSLIIVPVKEAAFLFVGFFGYYPIIKSKLEQLRPRLIEYLVKFLIFNASVIGCYAILIYIMGIDEVLEETGMFGQYSLLVLILLGNIMFIIYDFAITNLTYVYTSWFRPKILRKIQ